MSSRTRPYTLDRDEDVRAARALVEAAALSACPTRHPETEESR